MPVLREKTVRNYDGKYEAGWEECKYEAEKRAWKKTGFADRDDLLQKTRELPLEKKMELLSELFIKEIAALHFKKKVEFLEGLNGGPLIVSKEEMLEYLHKYFSSEDWEINEHYIRSSYIEKDRMHHEIYYGDRNK